MNGTTSVIAASYVDRLCEVPLVALRVDAAVPAVAERQVVELLDDARSGCARPLAVFLNGVDEDDHLGGTPDRGRVPEACRRLADVDVAAVADVQLGVQAAGRARRPVDLMEAERAGEEVDRGLAVLVEQIRGHRLSHGAEA